MDLAEQLSNAARLGNEAEVQRLLAAGAWTDRGDTNGWLLLHHASQNGHVGVVRLLLKADRATALAVNRSGMTPLHCAAGHNRVEVMKLLLAVAPAAAAMLDNAGWAPIHIAAFSAGAPALQLLLEAAPEVAYDPNSDGYTALHLALRNRYRRYEQADEIASCLVRMAPAVEPALGTLNQHSYPKYDPHDGTLFVDLVTRLPLSQEQWQSIGQTRWRLERCPFLAPALPAVLQRSTAEAGWLVGKLAEEQRARLRAAALSLARAQHQCSAVLSAELNGRILALCLLDP